MQNKSIFFFIVLNIERGTVIKVSNKRLKTVFNWEIIWYEEIQGIYAWLCLKTLKCVRKKAEVTFILIHLANRVTDVTRFAVSN